MITVQLSAPFSIEIEDVTEVVILCQTVHQNAGRTEQLHFRTHCGYYSGVQCAMRHHTSYIKPVSIQTPISFSPRGNPKFRCGVEPCYVVSQILHDPVYP